MNESPQIKELRIEVANRLRKRRFEIVHAIHARIQAAVPEVMGVRDPAYQAGVLATVTAVLGYGLEAIEHGPGWSGPIPSEASDQGRRAARAGVSLGVVLRRYIAGHRRLGEFVAEEAEAVGIPSSESALRQMRSTLEALLEHLIAAVEHEYEQECRRIDHSPERRRVELVQSLLAGEGVGRPEFAVLGYDLDAWHVAVIAVGPEVKDVVGQLEADNQLLCVLPGEETMWMWLGWRRRPSNADIARLQLDQKLRDVGLAVGEPAQGTEGWRLTHQQAQRAMQVVLLWPQTHARYADVALVTPWLQDPESARSLIEIYLSPLAGQRDGGVVGLETLSAYFEAGRNASAAAVKLGVDRRTLAYRLRNIEECLGYQLESRLAELEVAVRLRALLSRPDCTSGKKLDAEISTLA